MAKIDIELNGGAISNQILKSSKLDSLLQRIYQKKNKTLDGGDLYLGMVRKKAGRSVSKTLTDADYKDLMRNGTPAQKRMARRYFSTRGKR